VLHETVCRHVESCGHVFSLIELMAIVMLAGNVCHLVNDHLVSILFVNFIFMTKDFGLLIEMRFVGFSSFFLVFMISPGHAFPFILVANIPLIIIILIAVFDNVFVEVNIIRNFMFILHNLLISKLQLCILNFTIS